MKELLLDIAKEYKEPKNFVGITKEILIEGALSGNIVKYVQSKLGCGRDAVTRATRNAFPDRTNINESLVKWLLSKRNLKVCASCKELLNVAEFYSNVSKSDGIAHNCKICSRSARIDTYNKDPQKELYLNYLRKRKTLKAIPSWADLDKIDEFYRNRPEGMHVDHIIPLNGELVSGLHVLENLQYLSVKDNLSKKNKYVP